MPKPATAGSKGGPKGKKGGKGAAKGGKGGHGDKKRKRPSDGKHRSGGKRARTGGYKGGRGGKKEKKPEALTREERKKLRKLRKDGKFGDVLDKAKELWYKIRTKTTKSDERKVAVESLATLIKDQMLVLVRRPDASRMVQCLIQFGKEHHHEVVLQELGGHWMEFIKSQHSHFLVKKVFRYCSTEHKLKVAKEMEGHVVRLATHNVGVLVLEEALCGTHPLPKEAQWRLEQELYSTEFKTFKSSHNSLAEAIEAEPAKKSQMLSHMLNTLKKQIDKELLGLTFVQRLVWTYMSHGEPLDVLDMVPSICEAALAMLSSSDGAKAVAYALGMGSAKHRKTAAKALKDSAVEAAMHETGHMVIIRALDVTDDTKLLGKTIVSELLPELEMLACSAHGRKVLLHVLAPGSTRYFSDGDRQLLEQVLAPKQTEKGLVMKATSKKPAEMRRSELLELMKESLVDMALVSTVKLLRSFPGGDVLSELYLTLAPPRLAEAVAEAVADSLGGEGDDAEPDAGAGAGAGAGATSRKPAGNLLDCATAHRVLKFMLGQRGKAASDSDESDETMAGAVAQFAKALLQQLQGRLVEAAVSCNRGAFTVTHLLAALSEEERAVAEKELQAAAEELKEAAKSTERNAGLRALLKALGEEGEGDDDEEDEDEDEDEAMEESKPVTPVARRTRAAKAASSARPTRRRSSVRR